MDDALYFRSLAARCRSAARDCFDLRAKEEFGKLADEFADKAAALERAGPVSPLGRGSPSANI